MSEEYFRILGIDYGTVRIGLAISDPMRIIAKGLKTIANDSKAIAEILKIVSERNVAKIVIGKPLTLKGEVSYKAIEVEKFIESLKAKTTAEIISYDERFTSVMAEKAILTMGMSKKQRRDKSTIDEIASAILLQGYLDGQKNLHP